VVNHTARYPLSFTGTFLLPISSESSPITRVYWSVTIPCSVAPRSDGSAHLQCRET